MIQDEHTVELTYGQLKKQRGILIQTKQGRVFIPAFCLPDIRRRLAGMQHQLENLPEPNRKNA